MHIHNNTCVYIHMYTCISNKEKSAKHIQSTSASTLGQKSEDVVLPHFVCTETFLTFLLHQQGGGFHLILCFWENKHHYRPAASLQPALWVTVGVASAPAIVSYSISQKTVRKAWAVPLHSPQKKKKLDTSTTPSGLRVPSFPRPCRLLLRADLTGCQSPGANIALNQASLVLAPDVCESNYVRSISPQGKKKSRREENN